MEKDIKKNVIFCNVNVHGASMQTHLRSKKHLENEKRKTK